ncbi:MAG: hypothetical protein AAFQ98_05525 [Bacteroidota bacterium]
MSKPFQLLAILSIILLSSCTDDCVYTWIDLQPQYGLLSDMRSASLEMESPRELENPGKIYYYQNMLLINEVGEGIHIYDNQDPENPTVIGFLPIPGNIDIAVHNNVLYADSYIDLVTFSVANWQAPVQLGRMENLYPSWSYPLGNGLFGWYDETQDLLITGYNEVEMTESGACNQNDFIPFFRGGDMLFASADMEAAVSSGSNSGGGQGGSMARFTLAANRLYAVDNNNLHIVSLDNPTAPVRTNEVPIDWGLETIFPYEDMLFFGTTTGMIIHSLANPDNPEYMSTVSHLEACDPVVVQGDYAYYTIRSGNFCGQGEDMLGVVDISNPYAPVEVATHSMDGPYGLGIDGETLFICEGDKGLKVFDASNYENIGSKLTRRYRNVHAWDVIPLGGVLLMVGEDGLYQYDYSDPSNIRELSRIATPQK